MGYSTLHKLSLVCLISTTVPASAALVTALDAAQRIGLLPRAATCGGNENLKQCGAGLPADFCCETSATCLQLNATTASVICCPAGQSCDYIAPITCDASQQNATLHPDNPVHLEDLTAELPKCGDACCPLGYACEQQMCTLKNSSSTSTAPATSSSTATSLPSSSLASSPDSSTGAFAKSSSFSGRSFAAGFFPGLIIGVLLVLGIIWLLKWRKSRKPRYSGDFGPVSRSVSDPIYEPAYSARTDFLRHNSTSVPPTTAGSSYNTTAVASPLSHSMSQVRSLTSTVTPIPSRTTTTSTTKPPRVRSFFSPKSPTATTMRSPSNLTARRYSAARRSRSRRSRGLTARLDSPKTGSTETIDVLMPESDAGFLQAPPPIRDFGQRPVTQQTTFTTLLENAGWSPERRNAVNSKGKEKATDGEMRTPTGFV